MSADFATRDDDRRRRRRNLIWIAPAALVVGTAAFFGIGKLVEWLWRVTLVDIFALKPISFWQAWGLILLSQILFKANLRPTTRTGRRWRRVPAGRNAPEMEPEQPEGNREG
ncbi:MAG: hypothetical protein A2V63_00905 [Candidatus Eisenbacteria bacterium RBG_19FT_COMBO_70_11]|nr:MAG: hypothetical protein A2V63_00905 [Candidatus Eisenbacteria bacterium RBG_19FT_COMBO_70_11]